MDVEFVVEERPNLRWDSIYNIKLGRDENDLAPNEPGLEEQKKVIEYDDDDEVKEKEDEFNEWYPLNKKKALLLVYSHALSMKKKRKRKNFEIS
ncbi:hypothetical protein CROQUDRAFT_76486 [Cronartium quercuum f. sp. fusiforme G11]|uniref:Uncharacterized protein n=1 Tax=Cronartium quercuum f. sp. fusiforme G11 TaxID=708437 RepID=A0A9P6TCQ2_9BASI|nr:hypothetical protein CROQUDRAFT_76486 [Cronartium quercuum f. sp. fusiforme G11]